MVRFLVNFTARHPGTEDEADDFTESFLGFLLNLATAKDKAVRFRVCQIVAGVLNSFGPGAEISDDLYERMRRRSCSSVSAIRRPPFARRRRALSRLQDGGEGGDFSEDAITTAFLQLLGAEKVKDVRKAIFGFASPSPTTPSLTSSSVRATPPTTFAASLSSRSPVRSPWTPSPSRSAPPPSVAASPSVPRRFARRMVGAQAWHLAFEGGAGAAALDAESSNASPKTSSRNSSPDGKIKPLWRWLLANGNPRAAGFRVASRRRSPSGSCRPNVVLLTLDACGVSTPPRSRPRPTRARFTAVGQNGGVRGGGW